MKNTKIFLKVFSSIVGFSTFATVISCSNKQDMSNGEPTKNKVSKDQTNDNPNANINEIDFEVKKIFNQNFEKEYSSSQVQNLINAINSNSVLFYDYKAKALLSAPEGTERPNWKENSYANVFDASELTIGGKYNLSNAINPTFESRGVKKSAPKIEYVKSDNKITIAFKYTKHNGGSKDVTVSDNQYKLIINL
ncbi:hypothetical protein JXZ92_01640 [Mycoplasma sp. CSL10137]|uniref:hypothetical protein n=1 Tax=unclassified Mycoplasma TaxID=2683645 RepID=UPI00197CB096|nr:MULTISPECIES: hypothetical protein [unclassified Mycoplasma]MBN4083523.1 hypothetical protein [Mycoplasma sp. CSL10137]MBN4084547.1 hypothetical protein [Mycoplasma sp. CSL10166]MBU4693025.1 hypothetical protein [Mycoplasma sp. CSL7491-lung]